MSLILSPGTRGAVLGLFLCSFWADPEGYEVSLYTLCHLMSLPLKGTLCHLVSGGDTKWQNDTKWLIPSGYSQNENNLKTWSFNPV